ncbi:hypothetical protein BOTBODRAFT_432032 [Botryobasidium botryosum FD-172 SS1]|uniref:Uncharacterized protein n=1 Tax=Botryobasidium botryosum (strain FD-172 SS1) TaxID=930990 RepID=A0A067M811_BOTB1|nr:hypothetical protein BOTBODRAFT_432032 [Botryobasidium botryosum FD-172 SS1]
MVARSDLEDYILRGRSLESMSFLKFMVDTYETSTTKRKNQRNRSGSEGQQIHDEVVQEDNDEEEQEHEHDDEPGLASDNSSIVNTGVVGGLGEGQSGHGEIGAERRPARRPPQAAFFRAS